MINQEKEDTCKANQNSLLSHLEPTKEPVKPVVSPVTPYQPEAMSITQSASLSVCADCYLSLWNALAHPQQWLRESDPATCYGGLVEWASMVTWSRLPTAPWHMALCPAAEPASGLTGTWFAAQARGTL